jgi:hypothetical protein
MDDGNEGTEAGGSKKARNAVGMVAQEHRDAYQSLPASPELPSLLLSRALTTASPDGGEGAGKEELQAQKGEESEEARQGAATAAKEMEDKKKDTEAKGMKEHVCGKCSGAFKTALGLKVHISKAHSKDKAAEEEEEEEEVKDVSMVCDRCGRADFKNLQVPLPRLRLDVVPDLLRFHHSSLFRVYHSVYSFVCVVVQWRKPDEGLSFLLVCTCLPLNASLFYIQGFKLHKTRWCKAPAEALAGERPADAEHSPQSTQSAKAEDDVVGAVLFKVTTPRTCRKARNGPQTGQEEGGS